MLNLKEIYRPRTLSEALEWLARPGTAVLAGGTGLLSRRPREVTAVVDLSALGLDRIEQDDRGLHIGALATLQQLADAPALRAAAGGIAAQAAHRTAASLLRNQATVGGTLRAEPDGILAAALAALDARIQLYPTAGDDLPLLEFLARSDSDPTASIITSIEIPAPSAARRGVLETVARTPRDRPIVAVALAVEGAMPPASVRVALAGVGPVVVRSPEAERRLMGAAWNDDVITGAAVLAAESTDPPADFRGSAEYRRAMVRVLLARALRTLTATRDLGQENEH